MGKYSAIAQVISAGLQNASVRTQLLRELMDHSANPTGVDLQSCGNGSAAQQLFNEGERRGFQGGPSLCEMVAKLHGLTLYMDRDRLAHWSASVAPVVTAVENPDKTLPARLVGYRSPTRTITFANDSSFVGPVLVILPFAHSSEVANHGAERMHVETRRYTPARPATTETRQ
jgi:hypothetical protein